MKRALVFFLASLPLAVFGQPVQNKPAPVIPSVNYTWQTPSVKTGSHLLTAKILSGGAHDFEYLEMDACTLLPSTRMTALTVPFDEENLIFVKSGTLKISFGDSTWSLAPGSIALLMPGEKFAVQGAEDAQVSYYLMRYRSKQPVDMNRGKASGGSFVKDWNKLKFREHDRGGVRSYFQKPTAMCKRLEMHVTTLKPALKSHDPHTHKAEEIILMLEDAGTDKSHTEMLIGDNSYQGHAGDLYYVGSGLLHGIKNIGSTTCSYFAFQFE